MYVLLWLYTFMDILLGKHHHETRRLILRQFAEFRNVWRLGLKRDDLGCDADFLSRRHRELDHSGKTRERNGRRHGSRNVWV